MLRSGRPVFAGEPLRERTAPSGAGCGGSGQSYPGVAMAALSRIIAHETAPRTREAPGPGPV